MHAWYKNICHMFGGTSVGGHFGDMWVPMFVHGYKNYPLSEEFG